MEAISWQLADTFIQTSHQYTKLLGSEEPSEREMLADIVLEHLPAVISFIERTEHREQ